jgi:hypothetical protein
LEGNIGQAVDFRSNKSRVEEDLSGIESLLVINLNDCLTVRELIRSLFLVEGIATLESLVKVKSNSAHLLLHVSDILEMIFIYDDLFFV